MPTVLSILNYDKPFLAFGNNLVNNNENSFALNYFGNYQLIENQDLLCFDFQKTVGLYNFVDDNLLKNNLKDKQPKRQIDLEIKAKAIMQQYQNRLIENRLTVK